MVDFSWLAEVTLPQNSYKPSLNLYIMMATFLRTAISVQWSGKQTDTRTYTHTHTHIYIYTHIETSCYFCVIICFICPIFKTVFFRFWNNSSAKNQNLISLCFAHLVWFGAALVLAQAQREKGGVRERQTERE